jgi:hypothetical protein
MDRIDRDFMLEEAKRQREERAAELQAAGPLFDKKQEAELQCFLEEQCWLKPAAVRDVMDTIGALAGEPGANARSVVKDALEGHVSQKFLANDGNFTAIIKMVSEAIEDLGERLKAQASPETPALAMNVKPPAPKR